jgi:hypothetical protein
MRGDPDSSISGWWLIVLVIALFVAVADVAEGDPSHHGNDDCIHSMAQMGC